MAYLWGLVVADFLLNSWVYLNHEIDPHEKFWFYSIPSVVPLQYKTLAHEQTTCWGHHLVYIPNDVTYIIQGTVIVFYNSIPVYQIWLKSWSFIQLLVIGYFFYVIWTATFMAQVKWMMSTCVVLQNFLIPPSLLNKREHIGLHLSVGLSVWQSVDQVLSAQNLENTLPAVVKHQTRYTYSP